MSTSSGEKVYKGKITHRSWPQLPQELIRHIATFYLLSLSRTSYLPRTWSRAEKWQERMMYTALRDARELQCFMNVAPSWGLAVEHHPFWLQTTSLLDPRDALSHQIMVQPAVPVTTNSSSHAPPPTRLSPFAHAQNLSRNSCHICLINNPPCANQTSPPRMQQGLQTARRMIHTPTLHNVPVCKDHHNARIVYCGVCLVDSPFGAGGFYGAIAGSDEDFMIVENEDDNTFPDIDSTCRTCRLEALSKLTTTSRRVNPTPRGLSLVDALGGPGLSPPDWETRGAIDSFVELSEGTISEVVNIALEKHWLRIYTKLPDMLEQSIASAKFVSSTAPLSTLSYPASHPAHNSHQLTTTATTTAFPTRPLSPTSSSASSVSSYEDDPDLHALHEDTLAIRDLALSDWARNRILDGHWLTPADQWYGSPDVCTRTAVKAIHPCSWSLEPSLPSSAPSLPPSSSSSTNPPALPNTKKASKKEAQVSPEVEEHHPKLETLTTPAPPSFMLCEQSFAAFARQLRIILLPAMINIVRRVVIECAADSVSSNYYPTSTPRIPIDPTIRLGKMTIEDVVHALSDQGVWYEGFDWLERRRNEREDKLTRKEEDESSDKSSPASSTTTTKSVLSSSTLGTTPSPPPAASSLEEEKPVAAESIPKTDPAEDSGKDDEDDQIRSSVERSEDLAAEMLAFSERAQNQKEQEQRQEQERDLQFAIPVTPALSPPVLLHPIPYVPETTRRMEAYTIDLLKNIWRDACSPLYHCRCSICERAMAREAASRSPSNNHNNNNNYSTHTTNARPQQYLPPPNYPPPQQQQQQLQPALTLHLPAPAHQEIRLHPRKDLEEEEEEEEEYDEYDYDDELVTDYSGEDYGPRGKWGDATQADSDVGEYGSDEDDDDSKDVVAPKEHVGVYAGKTVLTAVPNTISTNDATKNSKTTLILPPRKKRSYDLEDPPSSRVRVESLSSPNKKARIEAEARVSTPTTPTHTTAENRKRSSEELDAEDLPHQRHQKKSRSNDDSASSAESLDGDARGTTPPMTTTRMPKTPHRSKVRARARAHTPGPPSVRLSGNGGLSSGLGMPGLGLGLADVGMYVFDDEDVDEPVLKD